MRVELNSICQFCTAGYDRCDIFVDCGYMGLMFRHGGRQRVACRKKARARGSHTQNYVVLQAVESEQDIES